MVLARTLVIFVGSSLAMLAGCSGASTSDFGMPGDNNGAVGDGKSQGAFSNSSGDGGVGGTSAACATSTASGELSPVDLVFMFDKSGSMNTIPSGSSTSKFDAVKGGLLTFAADGASAGMNAQLTFFGQGSGSAFCDAATYTANVKVPVTALPDTTALSGGFSGVSPSGNTPTAAALGGALAQASTLAAAHPDHKVAVVVLTDGEPQGCSDDGDITPAANEAHTAFTATPSIPTYVIGVGDLKTNLDTLASQGGTTSAYILTDTNTAMTNTELIAALGSIRGKTASCDFTLPAPPNGETLDINAVNVEYTPSGGSTQTLTYNKDCTGGDGWHYDNPSAPTQIVLCDNACNEVKSQATGKVDIAFGCATKGGVAR